MTNLGILYEYGRGVPKDYQKAKEWYEKGAAAGDERAKDLLRALNRKR
jgi:TPR repeat protein